MEKNLKSRRVFWKSKEEALQVSEMCFFRKQFVEAGLDVITSESFVQSPNYFVEHCITMLT